MKRYALAFTLVGVAACASYPPPPGPMVYDDPAVEAYLRTKAEALPVCEPNAGLLNPDNAVEDANTAYQAGDRQFLFTPGEFLYIWGVPIFESRKANRLVRSAGARTLAGFEGSQTCRPPTDYGRYNELYNAQMYRRLAGLPDGVVGTPMSVISTVELAPGDGRAPAP